LDIVQTCRSEFPTTAVIMVTGHGSVETAVEAMRLGAFDYLTKPFDLGDMVKTVNHALNQAKQGSAPAAPTTGSLRNSHAPKMVGHSEAIQKMRRVERYLPIRPPWPNSGAAPGATAAG
jgi:DNA-binding NtrC family response regulator